MAAELPISQTQCELPCSICLLSSVIPDSVDVLSPTSVIRLAKTELVGV